MNNKDTIALFKLFLEMNNALIPYLEGINTINGVNVNPSSKFKTNCYSGHRDGTQEGYGVSFIGRAFGWCFTKEGSKYWCKLDYKWKEVLDALKDNS